MKILVVEDEPKVASFIKQGLEEQSYKVTLSYDGLSGYKLATENDYDVIILDLMLPFMNGLDVCRKLREANIKTPILILTALGSTDDKVTGLDSGADDYMVKPFEFKELVARLKALRKRYTDTLMKAKILKLNDLEMNLDHKTVMRGGKSITLTAKEFSLLEFMLRNKNKVLSRTEISEKVWDIHFDTGTNVIDVYMNFLRKKIDKDFDKKLIHTMVGMGYVIKSTD